MKYILPILYFLSLAAYAATTPTKNVTQETSSKAITDSIVVPSGLSVTVNNGATLTAPTATDGTNTTQVATTAFVQAALAGAGAAISNPSVAYVMSNGSDTTGAIADPSKPYASLLKAYSDGARVFVLGVGEFTGLTVTTLDIVLIGQGASQTIVGNITGTSGSIYGLGPDTITVGEITIQPAPGANGADGNPAASTAAGNGGDGGNASDSIVAGLTSSGDAILQGGSGGSGGYGGDAVVNLSQYAGGNGGNGGSGATLRVRNCRFSGYAVSLGGDAGNGGAGTNFTDNSTSGGNGGNGGNPGAPGTVILENSTVGGVYAATAQSGAAGAGGTGSSPGNAGTAGATGSAGTINATFSFATTGTSNGETTNYVASYIGGVWTLPPAWGQITGTLSAQTDLQSALDAKEPTITAGQLTQYYRGDKTMQVLNAAAVGLDQVENIAVDTWAGSASITTLGTITSGTWSGTIIAAAHGGTGMTSYTTGDLLYASGPTTLSKLAGNTTPTLKVATSTGTGSAANAPTYSTASAVLDSISSTQGTILYRGASTWSALSPGTSGQYLKTQGASANPIWSTVSAGTVTSVAASVPSFLSVSGSPVTSSGTLAITLSGTALPAASGGTGQTTLQSAINALAAASGALSQGDILYYNGTNIVRLGAGTANYVLNTGGAGANPSWGSNAITIAGSSTALGSSITQDTITGLASTGIVKRTAANTLAIATSGTDYGNVSGPGSSTDKAVPRWNGTGGSTLQNSSMTIDNSGNVLVNGAAAFTTPMLGIGQTNQGFASIGSGRIDCIVNGTQAWTASAGAWFSVELLGVTTNAINFNQYNFTGPQMSGTTLGSDACLVVANSTTAQRFSVMNTYSSSTNFEGFEVDWKTAANVCILNTAKGSGGGTARNMSLRIGGAEKVVISSTGLAVGTTGTPHSKIKSGTAVLVAGTVTVSDSDVLDTGNASTSSRIIITRMNDGGTMGDSYSITRSNGASFTITAKSAGSTQILDTSTVSWLLLNP